MTDGQTDRQTDNRQTTKRIKRETKNIIYYKYGCTPDVHAFYNDKDSSTAAVMVAPRKKHLIKLNQFLFF